MQEITRGELTIGAVGEQLAARGFKKIFLVTGRHLAKQEIISDKNSIHYIKQGVNVVEKEVEKAFSLFRESGSDAILAIGGGSVIDLAKAIIYRCVQDSVPLPFFTAAPTTIGSGTEATHFAVVYNKGKKFSWVHPALLPAWVILDPTLVSELPAYQAAVTGIDALAQAIESYWSSNATDESKAISSAAIRLCMDNYFKAVKGNEEARSKMLEAAHAAGQAINITRTTGPHALSYYLTIHHGVAHGQAVGLFLPVFFLYNTVPGELTSLLGVKNAKAAKEFLQLFMKRAGLAITLEELGINKTKVIDALLEEVNEERFANNPAPFDRERLKKLINENL